MTFDAPWDKTLKTITWSVATFLIVEIIGISIALYLTTTPTMALLVTILVAISNGLILGFTYLYAPQGYRVDENGVTVLRKRRPLHIGFDTFDDVSRIERERFMKALRTFGNGGLFGYYGSFRNKELGSFKMYATHGDLGVLLHGETNCVVTPDRPDEFVQTVRSYMS